jgi:hypothetical protein
MVAVMEQTCRQFRTHMLNQLIIWEATEGRAMVRLGDIIRHVL